MFDFDQYKTKMRSSEHYVDAPLNARFRSMIAAIPSGSKVLEIACGSGTLLAALRDKNCTCAGFDMAPEAVRLSKSKGLDVIEGDADAFDSDENLRRILSDKYDVVIFSKCLMYLRRRNEIISSLKTKTILINQGNPYYWKFLFNLMERPPETIPHFLADNTPTKVDTPRSLVRWGESFGYKGRIVHGGWLRGRDLVFRLDRL